MTASESWSGFRLAPDARGDTLERQGLVTGQVRSPGDVVSPKGRRP